MCRAECDPLVGHCASIAEMPRPSFEFLLYGRCATTLSAENDIDAGEQQLHLGGGQFADTFGEEGLIQRDDL
jgi:hypothetical protein